MESALAASARANVTVVGMEAAPFEVRSLPRLTLLDPANFSAQQAILGSEIGNGIRKFHESKGTKFFLPAALSHFTPSTSTPTDVGAVVLKDGTEIPADFVILGVGVKPATGLLRESGISIEKDSSVLVDENLRLKGVARGNVFAIGDIAKYPDSVTGELTRVEHWNVAAVRGSLGPSLRPLAYSVRSPEPRPQRREDHLRQDGPLQQGRRVLVRAGAAASLCRHRSCEGVEGRHRPGRRQRAQVCCILLGCASLLLIFCLLGG